MMKKKDSLTKYVIFGWLIVVVIGYHFFDWKFAEISFCLFMMFFCVFFVEILNRLSSINDTLGKILENLHEERIEK